MLKTVELGSDKIVSVEIVILEHIRPNTRVCQGISYAGRRFSESQPRRRPYSSNRVYKSSNISKDEHLTPPEPRERLFLRFPAGNERCEAAGGTAVQGGPGNPTLDVPHQEF